MKAFLILVLVGCAWPLLQGQTPVDSIPIKVPAGMKPMLTKSADGGWILEIVPTEAAAPAADDTAEEKSASTTGSAAPKPKTRDEFLNTAFEGLDWKVPVPTSPAFTALGISPENVSSPTNPTELALSLLNGSDRQGRIQTGFAVDFSPFMVFGPELSHDEYAGSWWLRTLYNTTVSLAATKLSEDEEAQRVALGVSIRLWNSEEDAFNDILPQAAAEINNRWPVIPRDPRPGADNSAIEAQNLANDALVEAHLQDLFNRMRTHTWGRGSASIAWAPTWLSKSGNWNDLEYDGSTIWTSISFQLNPLSDSGELARPTQRFWHLLGQAQYRDGETVTGKDDTDFKQDSLLLAARLRYGTVNLNGSAEVGYLRTWDGPYGDGDAVRFGLSLEQRVANNTWLVVSGGHDVSISGDERPDESFIVGGIRFGLSEKPNPEVKEEMRSAVETSRKPSD